MLFTVSVVCCCLVGFGLAYLLGLWLCLVLILVGLFLGWLCYLVVGLFVVCLFCGLGVLLLIASVMGVLDSIALGCSLCLAG